jgi:tRNA 2-selenouridine synthase
MIVRQSIIEFLNLQIPIVDVRSPLEFEAGHIELAVNIPILNNQNRIHIGKTFKQKGREAAIKLGFELVNPIKPQLLESINKTVEGRTIALYCARGGLRSNHMAAFFAENGYTVYVLNGGYKAFRNHLLSIIAQFKRIMVLSAHTGSGKTEILHALKRKGAQVLDLEGLAKHKGSVFGALGNQAQPNSAAFHNLIFEELKHYNPNEVLWVENESFTIGQVHLPIELWTHMKEASGIEISVPLEERVKFIESDYGRYTSEELVFCIQKLNKRLGDEACRKICELVQEGDLEEAIYGLFKYYDKAYEMGRIKRNCHHYVKIPFEYLDPIRIAEFLYAHQNKYSPEFN